MSFLLSNCLRPTSLEEARRAVGEARRRRSRVVAGGTDLMPSMKQKLFTPPYCWIFAASSRLKVSFDSCDGSVRSGR